MVGPIATGYMDPGHNIEFVHAGEGAEKTCTAKCECGWSAPLTAWNKSWGVVEFNAVMRRHLGEVGAT